MSSTARSTVVAVPAEFAIGVREMLVESLEREIPVTRKVIAAVPENKLDWRPEQNSRTAWDLANHLAKTDVWFLNGIADQKFPEESKDDPAKNIADLATWYEKSMKAGIERVRKTTPQQLITTIDFFGAFNLPAFAYLQFCLNHSIHHRAQLGIYLRPMGSKCPSIYGGSFDEPWQG